jgi:hypothetical protein
VIPGETAHKYQIIPLACPPPLVQLL